jgi:hypothetical protein
MMADLFRASSERDHSTASTCAGLILHDFLDLFGQVNGAGLRFSCRQVKTGF